MVERQLREIVNLNPCAPDGRQYGQADDEDDDDDDTELDDGDPDHQQQPAEDEPEMLGPPVEPQALVGGQPHHMHQMR
eukprot:15270159-Heterocapsa_arctica.AAC.1